MPYPISEQITQAVAALLSATDDVLGEPIAGVVRPTKLGNYTPQHLLIVVEEEDRRPGDPLHLQGNASVYQWVHPLRITLWVRPSDRDTTPVGQFINTFLANVEKAIAADERLGGLATDYDPPTPQGVFTEDGAFEGVEIVPAWHYRVASNDPYTKR